VTKQTQDFIDSVIPVEKQVYIEYLVDVSLGYAVELALLLSLAFSWVR